MEDPLFLSGAHIEGHDVALHVRLIGAAAGLQCRTHDERVMRDGYRRAVANLPRRISLVVEVEFFEEVHDAVFAETGNGDTVLCVQCDQLESRSDKYNALVTASIGPV